MNAKPKLHVIECVLCGSHDVEVRYVDVAEAFGLPAITLKNVRSVQCAECDEAVVSIPQHGNLMNYIRHALCYVGRQLVGSEVAFLREGMELSQVELADLLQTTNVTMCRWETDKVAINDQADLLIRVLTLSDLAIPGEIDAVLKARRDGEQVVNIDVQQFNQFSYAFEFTQDIQYESEDGWTIDGIRNLKVA